MPVWSSFVMRIFSVRHSTDFLHLGLPDSTAAPCLGVILNKKHRHEAVHRPWKGHLFTVWSWNEKQPHLVPPQLAAWALGGPQFFGRSEDIHECRVTDTFWQAGKFTDIEFANNEDRLWVAISVRRGTLVSGVVGKGSGRGFQSRWFLRPGSADFLYKRPESKYFRLLGPYSLCDSYTLP